MHPGSYTTGSEAAGLRLIGMGLRTLLRARRDSAPMILLEHTAGQGRISATGSSISRPSSNCSTAHPVSGICLDTCHLLAAGYDICSQDGYEQTFREFDRIVGIDRIKVFHLNDSKKPCGSRVDRHEHIGKGCLGLDPFRWLLNDPRFAGAADAAGDPEAGDAGEHAERAMPTPGTCGTCARSGG